MLRERKGGCPWCSPPVAAATTGKARPRAAHLAAREWREREPQRLIRTMRTRAYGVSSRQDRKSAVEGKSGSVRLVFGGCRHIKKKKNKNKRTEIGRYNI